MASKGGMWTRTIENIASLWTDSAAADATMCERRQRRQRIGPRSGPTSDALVVVLHCLCGFENGGAACCAPGLASPSRSCTRRPHQLPKVPVFGKPTLSAGEYERRRSAGKAWHVALFAPSRGCRPFRIRTPQSFTWA